MQVQYNDSATFGRVGQSANQFSEQFNSVMNGLSIKDINQELSEESVKNRGGLGGASPHTAGFPTPGSYQGHSVGQNPNLNDTHELYEPANDSMTNYENKIHSMIRDELQLDCHYIPEKLVILVIINFQTLDNSVLCEW